MSEDRYASPAAPREEWLFTHLFRTFRVALDPKKLLLAAAGIVVMACGWWLLSVTFYSMYSQPNTANYQIRTEQEYAEKYPSKSKDERDEMRAKEEANRNKEFNEDLDYWLRLHYLAGKDHVTVEYLPEGKVRRASREAWGGKLRTLPWFEDRGPNPYLLVTGQVQRPWETGHFWDWFLGTEIPVLIEPLAKFLEPVIYLLHPKSSTVTRFYLLLVILWTLATWAFFGGAITRMASVELAGKDPVSMMEALRFVCKRYVSYLMSPIVPLGLVAVLLIVSIVFGALGMIPFVGDIFVSGLFWPLMILVGLGMALLLVGLVGYPLMYSTISVEGSDTLDALSRSYNYVYQSPWNFIWYSAVSIVYGAVVIFFVGFMGSLTIYLGKWAVSNTPGIKYANRSPEYLFIYAPTSFGWREMLLTDSPAEDFEQIETEKGSLRRRDFKPEQIEKRLIEENRNEAAAATEQRTWISSFRFFEHIGAGMVSIWVTLVFLMILGFGYSFFWTASSMIYLLMRRKVDDMDIDEVYLEDSESSDPFSVGPTVPLPTTNASPAAPSGTMQVQETLTVRSDRPNPPPAAPPSPPPPTDGTSANGGAPPSAP
jgi:hypothetical protein